MNPFDLRGPEFLLFYAALGAAVFGVVLGLRAAVRPTLPQGRWIRDPYSVAYLRGGPGAVLRIAVLSLLGRDRLVRSGTLLVAAPGASSEDPLEQAVLRHFALRRRYASMRGDERLQSSAEAPRPALERQGHLLGVPAWRSLRRTTWAAMATLLGVGVAKLVVALARDRTNVLGLLVLLAVYAWLGVRLLRRLRRTGSGDAALRDLRSLFGSHGAVRAGSGRRAADPEFLLTAAVVGVTGPPFDRRARRTEPEGSGTSCGTTVGCGGGCGGGGGGCGGGCGGGGCGGCGS